MFASKTIAGKIDENAKDLTRALLAPNPNKRIGADKGVKEM